LDKVAFTYIKLHFATIPFNGNEFHATMEAIKTYYVDTTSEFIKTSRKRKSVLNRLDKGSWTLPGVMALNNYLKGNRLTPISFTLSETNFINARRDRASRDRVIWTKGQRVKVRNREEVIKELHDFAANVLGHPVGPILENDGPPADDVGEPAPQRARFALAYDEDLHSLVQQFERESQSKQRHAVELHDGT